MGDRLIDDLVSGLPRKPGKSVGVLQAKCLVSKKLAGPYSMLDGRPCFRQISEDGFWQELLLQWREESKTWCLMLQPEGSGVPCAGKQRRGCWGLHLGGAAA